MKRLVIITVGKTHSGKTTFAKELEQQLNNSLVIDQDNHAEFINTYYKTLLPQHGPNTIKYAITKTIIDYAIRMTDFHLILCNSNRDLKSRLDLLTYFHNNGFGSIIVNFNIPDNILQERIANSQRSKSIFRTASNFNEVLNRQITSYEGKVAEPKEDEANHLFVIKNSDEVQAITRIIVNIASIEDQ